MRFQVSTSKISLLYFHIKKLKWISKDVPSILLQTKHDGVMKNPNSVMIIVGELFDYSGENWGKKNDSAEIS